jgi:hypothetical protein
MLLSMCPMCLCVSKKTFNLTMLFFNCYYGIKNCVNRHKLLVINALHATIVLNF